MAQTTPEALLAPPRARPTPAALFFPLLLPFGVVVGYAQVTTPYTLDQLGFVATVATLSQQIGGWPHWMKIFWAPALDARGGRKAWFVGSLLVAALGMMGTVLVDAKAALWLYTTLLFIANVGAGTSSAAVDALMATTVPFTRKGAAAGWSMAGNLAGTGVGGALANWLTQHQSKSVTAGVLTLLILLCGAPIVFIDEPAREPHPIVPKLKALFVDLYRTARSRDGWTGLIICLSPVGAGAAVNLFSGAMHKDYGVSEYRVEFVTGVVGGLVSALGCLAGGWLADRMSRRLAYALSGAVTALIAVYMAFGPLTQDVFTYGTLAYQFTNGIAYAAFVAFVLEMIGHEGAVATKYTLFVAASNAAINYTAEIDAWGYDKARVKGLFLADAAATAVGIAIVAMMMLLTRKRPGAGAEAAPAVAVDG